jgi:hypothetical protein
LLSYRSKALSQEIATLVRHHLNACEFCMAETQLLAYYKAPAKGECKAPELPINLRILAESIMSQSRKSADGKTFSKAGLKL